MGKKAKSLILQIFQTVDLSRATTITNTLLQKFCGEFIKMIRSPGEIRRLDAFALRFSGRLLGAKVCRKEGAA